MGPGVLHKLRHQIVGINELTGSVEGWFAGESAAYGTFRYGIGSLPDQWLIERPLHRCAPSSGFRLEFVEPGRNVL